jgi:hypothetical protein
MKKELFYVIKQFADGTEELKGYNLTEEEKNNLVYSFKAPSGGNSSNCFDGTGVRIFFGVHKVVFKNKKQARLELITKPNEFNEALKVMEKYGLMVISKNAKIVSYQQMKSYLF